MNDPVTALTSRISWRVSSRSGSTGGQNCVEIGAWRTSTRTGSSGANCVEVGSSPSVGVAVRDTKHREGGLLTTDPAQWQALLTAVKTSALDR
ncbi:MAG: DUF397 domain-containing protein [Stackebrandtia sp.]